MVEFFFRPKARQDLEDIWFYTYETWGEEQADSYIYDLDNGFRAITNNPEKGRPSDDIRKGYRKYSVGKHIIFYRSDNKGIEIVRILHQKMDTDQHL